MGDGLDKGKEETKKDVEKWDDTFDGTLDFEVDNPTKDPSPNPMYVSATITLPSIVNQKNPKMTNASPETISSLVSQEGLKNLRVQTNNLEVQNKRKSLVNYSKTLKLGTKENEPITHKEH